MAKKVLLEVEVNDSGTITLAHVGTRVKARPVGKPRLAQFTDNRDESRLDVFTNRQIAIYHEAPSNANAYSIMNSHGVVEEMCSQQIHSGTKLAETIYSLPVQYFRIDLSSLRNIF